MEPVRSRCLCVRVPAPSHMAVQEQLALVARKEGLALPPELCARVAAASHRNLRRALLMLEVSYVQAGPVLSQDARVMPPDWELYIAVSAAGRQAGRAGRGQRSDRTCTCAHDDERAP
jgi:replication factor C subunit 3/5